MNKKEGIGNYKIGQKVAIYGYIDAVNIENRNDIENTTTLKINTSVKTISVNPKYEGVTTELNKPKPVVPQYVADWYEEIKEDFENKLFGYIRNFNIYNSCNESEDFNLWFDDNEDSIQTLVNMHQFGYEVEEEKRYIVKIKGITGAYNCLNYNRVKKMYSISSIVEFGAYKIKFTRKELEANGFGWVFDCKGVEITEVEE